MALWPTTPGSLNASELATPFQRFSRFNRDASVWVAISDAVLWSLAQRAAGLRGSAHQAPRLRCWSCGCSSGEEAYYLRMVWQRRLEKHFPGVDLHVLGTDLSEKKLLAAKRAAYPSYSVHGLPPDWLQEFFRAPPREGPAADPNTASEPYWLQRGRVHHQKRLLSEAKRRRAASATAASVQRASSRRITPELGSDDDEAAEDVWTLSDERIRGSVSFLQQDVTQEMPDGPFDLILSRYAVCLYLDADCKETALEGLVQRLRPGGFLVIGDKESLPTGFAERQGLTGLTYRTQHESCPFGPRVPIEGIFQKQQDEVLCRDLESGDPRARASTYAAFLRDTLAVDPDWIIERDRKLLEMTRKKMSAGSRSLLAKAALEGRRDEGRGVLDRMQEDQEARLERIRAREAERDILDGVVRPALSKDEAGARIQQFLERVGRDLANRSVHCPTPVAAKAGQIIIAASTPTSAGRRKRPPSQPGSRRSKSLGRTI